MLDPRHAKLIRVENGHLSCTPPPGLRRNEGWGFEADSGARPSSSIKKLVKVNMPNAFLGFGKARKLRGFLFEIHIGNVCSIERKEYQSHVAQFQG